MADLETVRGWYAEELRYAAGVKSKAVVEAFAAVPRERFLGPGPWLVGAGPSADKYWSTEDADPRCVYHNVVIGMLPEKGLNNGQPGLWAHLFDQLDLGPGRRVLHLGCGAGYYSAILAEIVGPTGRVTAVDLEEGLVARAREALGAWPHVSVQCGDGAAWVPEPTDTIVASAGATRVPPAWLDALSPGGQLLLPLTGQRGWGQVLLVTRQPGDRFAGRFVGNVGIYQFAGLRDAETAQRLDAAFARFDAAGVQSLLREPHAEDASCWLHGADCCLSRKKAAAS